MASIIEELKTAVELAQSECKLKEMAQAQLAVAQKDLSETKAALADVTKAFADFKAESEKMKAELSAKVAEQTELLKNPAFKSAAATAAATPENAAVAGQVVVEKTQADWNAEHDAIKNPRERALFREAHKKELGL
jgi:hypothetical protein